MKLQTELKLHTLNENDASATAQRVVDISSVSLHTSKIYKIGGVDTRAQYCLV